MAQSRPPQSDPAPSPIQPLLNSKALSIVQCVAKRRRQLERLEFALDATARKLCTYGCDNTRSGTSNRHSRNSSATCVSATADAQMRCAFVRLLRTALEAEQQHVTAQELFASAVLVEDYADAMPRLLELRELEDNVVQRSDLVWRVLERHVSSSAAGRRDDSEGNSEHDDEQHMSYGTGSTRNSSSIAHSANNVAALERLDSPFKSDVATTHRRVDAASECELLVQSVVAWRSLVHGSTYLSAAIARVQEQRDECASRSRGAGRDVHNVASDADADLALAAGPCVVLRPKALPSSRPCVVVNHHLAWVSLAAKALPLPPPSSSLTLGPTAAPLLRSSLTTRGKAVGR